MTAHLRKGPDRPHRRDDQGRPLCRMCGTLVKPPKRWWCGEECVEKRRLETLGAREMIEKRDKGVCALCGLDCERLLKRARRVRWLLVHLSFGTRRRPDPARWERKSLELKRRKIDNNLMLWVSSQIGRVLDKPPTTDRSWWEADHTMPLIEGGEHTPDNLRTLCIWCHHDETAKLAGRRADARRKQTRLFD